MIDWSLVPQGSSESQSAISEGEDRIAGILSCNCGNGVDQYQRMAMDTSVVSAEERGDRTNLSCSFDETVMIVNVFNVSASPSYLLKPHQ